MSAGDSAAAVALERFCFKFYLRGTTDVPLHVFVPVFQRWIQTGRLAGLLIDVVDYAHVPDGPGVALIGHEADYFLDAAEGPMGLLYNRKRLAQGTGEERLRGGLRAVLAACVALEQEPELAGRGLAFEGRRLRFIVNDRLAAPNDDRTLAALRPDLETVLRALWADRAARIERPQGDPRERFCVEAETSGPVAVATLLERLPV